MYRENINDPYNLIQVAWMSYIIYCIMGIYEMTTTFGHFSLTSYLLWITYFIYESVNLKTLKLNFLVVLCVKWWKVS